MHIFCSIPNEKISDTFEHIRSAFNICEIRTLREDDKYGSLRIFINLDDGNYGLGAVMRNIIGLITDGFFDTSQPTYLDFDDVVFVVEYLLEYARPYRWRVICYD